MNPNKSMCEEEHELCSNYCDAKIRLRNVLDKYQNDPLAQCMKIKGTNHKCHASVLKKHNNTLTRLAVKDGGGGKVSGGMKKRKAGFVTKQQIVHTFKNIPEIKKAIKDVRSVQQKLKKLKQRGMTSRWCDGPGQNASKPPRNCGIVSHYFNGPIYNEALFKEEGITLPTLEDS